MRNIYLKTKSFYLDKFKTQSALFLLRNDCSPQNQFLLKKENATRVYEKVNGHQAPAIGAAV